jgi:hypothetical protein
VVAVVVSIAGCAEAPRTFSPDDVDRLAARIRSLDASVDADEAGRAAAIAYGYSMQLREDYNVTDGPIIHNAKVNNGLRERGLCVHWAEDLEARLAAEGFETLALHRAIAEGNEFRIDHSTAIISARGADFDEGIVLDPWRLGGLLYWVPTREDVKYTWEPQLEVLARKHEAQQLRQSRTAADY